jgi:hypothetical protein
LAAFSASLAAFSASRSSRFCAAGTGGGTGGQHV